MNRPMTGKSTAPINVPIKYAVLTNDGLKARSRTK